MSRPARWTESGPPGSDFHEIIVLPTVAPELARQDASGAPSSVSATGEEASESQEAPLPDPARDRLFFVNVTVGVTKASPLSSKGKATKPQRQEETKPTTVEHPVFSMSRGQFITAALAAHRLDQTYKPGEHTGPPMQIYWMGSPGGKGHAPLIHTDDEWKSLLRQLRAKRTATTVNVIFDLNNMAGWGIKQPLSVDAEPQLELSFGTSVPSVDSYGPEARAQAQAAKEITRYWKCNEHQMPCFIGLGQHIQITPVRLKPWSLAVAAGAVGPADPPPAALLEEWSGRALSMPKARGRTGPGPALTPPPLAPLGDAGAGAAAAVMAAVMPLLTMVVERGLGGRALPSIDTTPASVASDVTVPVASHIAAPVAGRSSTPSTPIRVAPIAPSTPTSTTTSTHTPASLDATPIHSHSHTPVFNMPRSSPPPEINEELTRCLESFGRVRGVPPSIIDVAIGTLSDLSYTPDSIAAVTVKRLQELLPDMPEGQVIALQKYADDWYNKIIAKRARHSL
ncbi:hypothetical protein GSI_04969 [Ganoderma sinense ZZ0214-1]|uniref:Uncharacterized protein n=1 Tax=Ganoderma sinense ZZ0214-1 TaxID=1077348 RepID=A0A2G8SGH4_9APHY|nr:hypothetical protein GSI_04969 [Ganoderma sinense ZZ0214-1]